MMHRCPRCPNKIWPWRRLLFLRVHIARVFAAIASVVLGHRTIKTLIISIQTMHFDWVCGQRLPHLPLQLPTQRSQQQQRHRQQKQPPSTIDTVCKPNNSLNKVGWLFSGNKSPQRYAIVLHIIWTSVGLCIFRPLATTLPQRALTIRS